MSLAIRPRHRAAEIGTAARTITRRAPVTLTLVRQRAQPTAATIVRLTVSHLDRLRTELEAGKPDRRARPRRNRTWRLPHGDLQRLPPSWRRLIK